MPETTEMAVTTTPAPSNSRLRKRAGWLEREALRQKLPAPRARLLIAASEVRAMLGEKNRARRLANQAVALTPGSPMAERQARGFAPLPLQVEVHRRSLEREVENEEGLKPLQGHATRTLAILTCLCAKDPSSATALLAAAKSAMPDCMQLRVLDALLQLGRTGTAAVDLDEGPLHDALRQLARMLSAETDSTPCASLSEAICALTKSLHDTRLSPESKLSPVVSDEFGQSDLSQWLLVLLGTRAEELLAATNTALPSPGGPSPQTAQAPPSEASDRSEPPPSLSLRALQSLSERPSALVGRSFALQAFAEGQTELLSKALQTPQLPAEYAIALQLLTPTVNDLRMASSGGDDPVSVRELRPVLHHLNGTACLDKSASLAVQQYSYGRAVVLEPDSWLSSERLASLSASERALLLAYGSSESADLVQLAAALPRVFQSPSTAPVGLESQGSISQSDQAAPVDPTGQRPLAEAHFAAALLLLQARAPEAANGHFSEALKSPLTLEASLWALDKTPEGRRAWTQWLPLVQDARDNTHRAIAFTELLFRVTPDCPSIEEFASSAAQLDSTLPVAATIAEEAARNRGDITRADYWITARQQALAPDRNVDLCRVQQALLHETDQTDTAASRLGSLEAQQDLATAIWRERLDANALAEAAPIRLAAALRSGAIAASYLRAEAACYYEQLGDYSTASSVVDNRADELTRCLWEGLAEHGNCTALRTSLTERLGQEQRPAWKQYLQRRMARLEARHLDDKQSAYWYEQLYEAGDRSIETLQSIREGLLGEGQEGQLLDATIALAPQLPVADRLPCAYVVARLQTDSGLWASNANLRDWLPVDDSLPEWALRLHLAHCDSSDWAVRSDLLERLYHRSEHALDRATLALWIAEAQKQLGDLEHALHWARLASQLVSPHPPALCLQADLEEQLGQYTELATSLVHLSEQLADSPDKANYLYRAAQLWIDVLGNQEEGIRALCATCQTDPAHRGALQQLATVMLGSKKSYELCNFAVSQLERTDISPETQCKWSTVAARTLIRLGQFDQALQRLDVVLETGHSRSEALNLKAAVLYAQGKFQPAVDLWHLCLQSNPDAGEHLEALRGLVSPGVPIDIADRRKCFEEILDRAPEDQIVRRQLIRMLLAEDETNAAIEHQSILLQYCTADAERLEELLRLVELHERTSQGLETCTQLLAQAHRTWPDNSTILAAEVQHYRRTQRRDIADLAIDRAVTSARNVLASGRIDQELLRTVEVGSRLRGDALGERLARGTLSALRGKSIKVSGLEAQCGSPRFDTLTIPQSLDDALVHLLSEAGYALESSFTGPVVDGAAFNSEQLSQVQAIAAQFGLSDVAVVISESLGCTCIPMRAAQPTLIFGRALVNCANVQVRDFLLLRALKLLQLRACALVSMPKDRSVTTLAGLLACFVEVPNLREDQLPAVLNARDKIAPAITRPLSEGLSAQLPTLANQLMHWAPSVATALQQWACRTALLGVGEISPCLLALWLAAEAPADIPSSVETRMQWIAGHELASDLTAYSVGEAFASALRK